MRKMVFGRQLSRGKKSREALFRSLIKALVINGKIITTKAKAKAIQGQVDKLITALSKQTVSTKRKVLAYLANDKGTTDRFTKIAKVLSGGRNSGFTRMILLPNRLGDGAEMARLEFTEVVKIEEEKKAEKKETKKEMVKDSKAKKVEKPEKRVSKTVKK